MLKLSRPLIIYEMANNHMGSIDHGKRIISEMHKVSQGYDLDFGFKFQYRNLDTFIHPDYKERMDLKFVKRFSETRLSEEQFLDLKKAVTDAGFKAICTPFDEVSVDKVIQHEFDYLKIASCSIRDWPLLEKIVTAPMPIIASSGGAEITDVDNVVSFFKHKNKEFALMHCVGMYPTPNSELIMNRIDWFHKRYPDLTIGFSTHEDPDELMPAIIAVAKHAKIFEKHVAVETENYKANAYSAKPEQVRKWLDTIQDTLASCGPKSVKEFKVTEKELDALMGLKRGVFAAKDLGKGEVFNQDDVFFAMPNSKGQLTSEAFSKHHLKIKAGKDFKKNEPITDFDVIDVDPRSKIANVIHTMNSQLNQAGIVLNPESDVELSHHYGVDRIEEIGAVLITCINREYAKKLVVQIPGQFHPEHMHKLKEETFQVLWGSVHIKVNGKEKMYYPGDIVTIKQEEMHSFWTEEGVIFEEVSTTHRVTDSFYQDGEIAKNDKRKTNLKDWWMTV